MGGSNVLYMYSIRPAKTMAALLTSPRLRGEVDRRAKRRRAGEGDFPQSCSSRTFRASPEVPLQTFERHPRSAAPKAVPGEVIVLNILDLTQDRLAREMALAAAD